MSKKTQLAFKKYYHSSRPGVFSDESFQKRQSASNTESFDEVLQHLIHHEYISLTREGNANLLPKGVFISEKIQHIAGTFMENDGAQKYKFTSIFATSEAHKNWPLISKFQDRVYHINSTSENFFSSKFNLFSPLYIKRFFLFKYYPLSLIMKYFY